MFIWLDSVFGIYIYVYVYYVLIIICLVNFTEGEGERRDIVNVDRCTETDIYQRIKVPNCFWGSKLARQLLISNMSCCGCGDDGSSRVDPEVIISNNF